MASIVLLIKHHKMIEEKILNVLSTFTLYILTRQDDDEKIPENGKFNGVESNSERRHLSEDKFQVANEIKANHVDQTNLLNKTV